MLFVWRLVQENNIIYLNINQPITDVPFHSVPSDFYLMAQ